MKRSSMKKKRSDGVRVDDKHLVEEFEWLIATARKVSEDVGDQVETILREGLDEPFDAGEARHVLERVVAILQEHGDGGSRTAERLERRAERLIRELGGTVKRAQAARRRRNGRKKR